MEEFPFEPEILQIHQLFIRSIARALLSQEQDVEDTVQETWLAAIKNPPEQEKARAWFGSVTRRLSIQNF